MRISVLREAAFVWRAPLEYWSAGVSECSKFHYSISALLHYYAVAHLAAYWVISGWAVRGE